MARELEKLVDFKLLEYETQKAVQDDKLYWIRNAAKIRAASGKLKDYEEFRQIVEAAHLKPLEKKDSISTSEQKTVWNPICKRTENYRQF